MDWIFIVSAPKDLVSLIQGIKVAKTQEQPGHNLLKAVNCSDFALLFSYFISLNDDGETLLQTLKAAVIKFATCMVFNYWLLLLNDYISIEIEVTLF